MIETTLKESNLSHILIDCRLSDAREWGPGIKIRILPDSTGWVLLADNWIEAQFFVSDPLQKLDLNDKAT